MSTEILNQEPVTTDIKTREMLEEIRVLKENEEKLQRREKILLRRIHLKEQEMQDYMNQITELKSAQTPGTNSLKTAILDPAVNIIFQKLKNELKATKAKLEETQNELTAWKFTPDSNTGKRLMAKCRQLYQENEELGRMTSNGRLAKLEGDLSFHKGFCEELKKSQSEAESVIQSLDEDVEGLTSTIIVLQQELKHKNEKIAQLEAEIARLAPVNPENFGTDLTAQHPQFEDSPSQEIRVENGTPE